MLLTRSVLLEAKGIPTHLDEVAHVGVVPQHLYIMLDEQLGDALAVLEDKSHEVARPVYPDDLKALTPELKQQTRVMGNRAMNRVVVAGVALVLGIVLITSIT